VIDMTEAILVPKTAHVAHGAPFKRILCAVDGSPEAGVALEHAIALAGTDARITVAAVWSEGSALGRCAWDVVDQAVTAARAAGVKTSRRLIQAPRTADALVAAALGHDLLVVGFRPHSRVRGVLAAEVATALATVRPAPCCWHARSL